MIGLRKAAIAGMALLIGAPAASQPTVQTILIWSFGFSPRPIHLAAGRRVTLYFVNESGSSHDFTAGQFFDNSKILSGAVLGGQVDVEGHQTKSVTLVPRGGTYSAHCSHFFHKQMGMSDQIIVD